MKRNANFLPCRSLVSFLKKKIAKIFDPSCWLINNAKFEHSRDLVIENSQNLRSLGHLFN
jgi:hypothetical protein